MQSRPDHQCNFVEGTRLLGGSETRVLYRHYATLYFVMMVDSSESELGILDLIQVWVESLDRLFENVCELDLIFHAEQLHDVLNELVQGGMVLETNIKEITACVKEKWAEQQKWKQQPQLHQRLTMPSTWNSPRGMLKDVWREWGSSS